MDSATIIENPKVSDKDVIIRISNELNNFNIPKSVKGYLFLRTAILLAYKDFRYISNITKKLYPRIANKYQTTPSKVERAIRHAIEITYYREGNLKNLFEEKPPNGLFIATIADKLRIEDGIF
jgi:two-component system response regulator (stage 0 sporulation protein A)